MPQFDPELIEIMKRVLEDTMIRVPAEHSTPAAKAYFAEYILKAAAQGKNQLRRADRRGGRSHRGVCILVQLAPRFKQQLQSAKQFKLHSQPRSSVPIRRPASRRCVQARDVSAAKQSASIWVPTISDMIASAFVIGIAPR